MKNKKPELYNLDIRDLYPNPPAITSPSYYMDQKFDYETSLKLSRNKVNNCYNIC